MTPEDQLADFAATLARGFVSHGAALVVTAEAADRQVLVRARPHPEDVGKMLGTAAKMFNAMAALVRLAGTKAGFVDISYILDEDGLHRRGREPGFVARSDWQRDAVEAMLVGAGRNMFYLPHKLVLEDHGYKSNAYFLLSPEEPRRFVDDMLRSHLSTVFHAIGNANGRRLFVDGVERVPQEEWPR